MIQKGNTTKLRLRLHCTINAVWVQYIGDDPNMKDDLVAFGDRKVGKCTFIDERLPHDLSKEAEIWVMDEITAQEVFNDTMPIHPEGA